MSKEIKIACEGASMVPYTDLIAFQGDLKELTRDNYEALKKRILEDDFSDPISIWKGKNKIGNGHQRLRVVQQMVEKEGYTLKDNLLPVSYVIAKSEKQFARKVLALAGNYGSTSKEGLHEYLHKWDFNVEEFAEGFRLAGIDNTKFIEEFYADDIEDDLDLSDEVEVANEDEPHPEGVETSQVRMVQLFFDSNTAHNFTEMIEELKEYYGTTNVTDTVLNCVKESHNAHNKAARTQG